MTLLLERKETKESENQIGKFDTDMETLILGMMYPVTSLRWKLWHLFPSEHSGNRGNCVFKFHELNYFYTNM